MGHRREVFRPKKRSKIRSQLLTALEENNFKEAAQIAAFSYSRRPIADDFAISFIATAEAIKLGRRLNWDINTDDLAHSGLAIAEKNLETNVNPGRRRTIINSIAKGIEIAKSEASS